jgi:YesN/AraC family two-component response regulator
MNATSTIRTLVADDEPLARKGIRVWLESERDINIIGEATDGEEAAESIRELKPDLVFLDVRMPGIDGFEVLEKSRESTYRSRSLSLRTTAMRFALLKCTPLTIFSNRFRRPD